VFLIHGVVEFPRKIRRIILNAVTDCAARKGMANESKIERMWIVNSGYFAAYSSVTGAVDSLLA